MIPIYRGPRARCVRPSADELLARRVDFVQTVDLITNTKGHRNRVLLCPRSVGHPLLVSAQPG
jgi:hypothetical protein